jgi:hypothetical protein
MSAAHLNKMAYTHHEILFPLSQDIDTNQSHNIQEYKHQWTSVNWSAGACTPEYCALAPKHVGVFEIHV